MKNYIFLFLKGLAMGAVNKIPGVSGGTVAFITGIYEDIINSIKKINFKSFKILFNRGFKDFYFENKQLVDSMDIPQSLWRTEWKSKWTGPTGAKCRSNQQL